MLFLVLFGLLLCYARFVVCKFWFDFFLLLLSCCFYSLLFLVPHPCFFSLVAPCPWLLLACCSPLVIDGHSLFLFICHSSPLVGPHLSLFPLLLLALLCPHVFEVLLAPLAIDILFLPIVVPCLYFPRWYSFPLFAFASNLWNYYHIC